MTGEKTYESGPLNLRLFETPEAVCLELRGMSMAREPSTFLLPIFFDALELADREGKLLQMDFQLLEYLNSSSISPVIRTLERARRGQGRVRVLYNKSLKWQALSFTALEIFRTADARVDVQGV